MKLELSVDMLSINQENLLTCFDVNTPLLGDDTYQ